MPTVLILHPSPYYCKGLAISLRAFRDFKITYAHTTEKAPRLANKNPDIFIANIEGLFFLSQMHNHLLKSKLRIILIVPDKQKPEQNSHVSGAFPIHENATPKEFYNTIVQSLNTELQSPMRLRKRKGSLSPREWDVAILLAEGNRNGEAAKILNIDQKTVCTYRVRLFQKLKIRSLTQLKEQLAELAAVE